MLKTSLFNSRTGTIVSFFVPDDQPGDMIRIDSPNVSGKSTPTSSNTTPTTTNFKELCLKILDGTPKAATNFNPVRRRKVNPYADIVTGDDQYAKAIQDAEEKEHSQKKGKKEPTKKSQVIMKTKTNSWKEDLEESESSAEESEKETNDDEVMKKGYMFPPTSERQTYLYLRNLWENINPPMSEDSIVNKWFAAVYYVDAKNLRKPKLFVGKVLKRFLEDDDGPATALQLDCLSPAVTTTTTELYEIKEHLSRDIGLFQLFNIISSPLDAEFVSNRKWIFREYRFVVKTFDMCVKLQREQEYNRFLGDCVPKS